MRLQFSGWFILAIVITSCKPTVSTVIFHSDMGKMTVSLSRNIPAKASAELDRFLAAGADSVTVEKVLHDGFIQFSFPASDIHPEPGQYGAPVSGALVLCNGRFYIVQGRSHTAASLDRWEQTSRRKITPAFREAYIKQGGALALEGSCIVLGNLTRGKEALDRIAALPNDANGRPLREVRVHVGPGR